MAAEIIGKVRDAGDGDSFSLVLPNAYWIPIVNRWGGQVTEATVLIKADLTVNEEHEVALGIFQLFQNASEEGFAQSLRSKYSEEDLISNLLSFYLAIGEEYTLEYIEDACGYLSKIESEEVYDWYVKHLRFRSVDEWANPRLATCSDARWQGCGFWGNIGIQSCPVCPLDKYCPPETRGFPTAKFNLIPEPEGNKWQFTDSPRVKPLVSSELPYSQR